VKNFLASLFKDYYKYGNVFIQEAGLRKAYLLCDWCGRMLKDGHASDEWYCSDQCEIFASSEEIT